MRGQRGGLSNCARLRAPFPGLMSHNKDRPGGENEQGGKCVRVCVCVVVER